MDWKQISLGQLLMQIDLQDGVIPFVGAGFSANMGYPTWTHFLKEQAKNTQSLDRIERHIASSEYEEAADELCAQLGNRLFLDAIENAFGDGRLDESQLNGPFSAIVGLARGPVITTNFDHVLERMFERKGAAFKHVVWGAKADIAVKAFRKHLRVLLKVHGDVEESAERVLTKAEYHNHYGDSIPSAIDQTRPLPKLLRLMIESRPFLFIGCSLSQDRTVAILQQVAQDFPALVHYAIVMKPESDQEYFLRQTFLSNLGIRPIWYPFKQHRYVQDILVYLAESLQSNPDKPSASQPASNTVEIRSHHSILMAKLLPLNLKAPFTVPVRTREAEGSLGPDHSIAGHTDSSIETQNKYYADVLGWIRANPSQSDLIEAIESVYTWRQPKGADSERLVNTFEGHVNFVERILDRTTKTLFIIGPRGSGKTFYLNYLMNTETDNLYKQSRITLYRAEISKLYRHNILRHSERGGLWSLEDYFYLHICYVTYKYAYRTGLWKRITSDKRMLADTIRNISPSADITNDAYKWLESPERILEKLEQLNRILKTVPFDTKAGKYFLFDSLQRELGLDFTHFLAKAILLLTQKFGYRPLLIFDGLDNVEYHLYPKLYHRLMDEVVYFCFNNDDVPNPLDSKTVISLRSETFEHVRQLRRDFHSDQGHEEFYITSHDIDDILSKKTAIAIEPKAKYFSDRRKDICRNAKKCHKTNRLLPSDTEYDREFRSFAATFLGELRRENELMISKCFDAKPQSLDSMFEIIYHWNLRQFLHNFLNIFRYSMLFRLKSLVAEDRSYVLTEGQLLNGNIYLNSAKGVRLGACIPNIFWFDSTKAKQVWHGLALYRILQLLHRGLYTRTKLVEVAVSFFDYNEAIVSQQFDTAVTYGMITSQFDGKSHVEYHPTKKGEAFLRYPFLDINQFYYMALDTPLSSDAVNNSKMVRYHLNHEKYWLMYIEACTLTSITLIRHILLQDTIEKDATRSLGIRPSLPRQIFPRVLINGISGQLSVLQRMNTDRYTDLIKDLDGLV